MCFPVDESMQKLFEGGKGSVFQRVLSWVPSNNHQLQLAGALAIANFARNGKTSGLQERGGSCGHCVQIVNTFFFFCVQMETASTW